MDHYGAIRRYYAAYHDRDRHTLTALLTPDFHFVSSFGEYRDVMVDRVWPDVGQAWASKLRIWYRSRVLGVVLA